MLDFSKLFFAKGIWPPLQALKRRATADRYKRFLIKLTLFFV